MRLRASAPTLRGFLKLYASLSTHKLAGFLDAGEEDMVQQMMALKLGGRSVSRVGAAGTEGGLMDGEMIVTSDLDFVIDDVSPPSALSLLLCVWTCADGAPRIWCILSSRPSAEGTRGGLSGIRSTLRACSTRFTPCRCPRRCMRGRRGRRHNNSISRRRQHLRKRRPGPPRLHGAGSRSWGENASYFCRI